MSLDLEAIEKRVNAATPGPWRVWDSCSWRRIGTEDRHHRRSTVIEPYNSRSDGHPDLLAERDDLEFVAHAREDIPALLAEVRKLREAAEKAKSLLDNPVMREAADKIDELERRLSRPDSVSEEAVEAVAKIICKELVPHCDPDGPISYFRPEPRWTLFTDRARAFFDDPKTKIALASASTGGDVAGQIEKSCGCVFCDLNQPIFDGEHAKQDYHRAPNGDRIPCMRAPTDTPTEGE